MFRLEYTLRDFVAYMLVFVIDVLYIEQILKYEEMTTEINYKINLKFKCSFKGRELIPILYLLKVPWSTLDNRKNICWSGATC